MPHARAPRAINLLLAIGVIVLLASSNAVAQTCTKPGDPDSELRRADLIADAQVVRLDSRQICYPDAADDEPCLFVHSATLTVLMPYKGISDKSIEVMFDPQQGGPNFTVGQRLLLSAVFQRENKKWAVAGYKTNECLLGFMRDPALHARIVTYRRNWLALQMQANASPHDHASWSRLAAFFEAALDYPGALTTFRRMTDLWPDDDEAWAGVGRMLFFFCVLVVGVVLVLAVRLQPKDTRTRNLLA